MAAKLCHLCGAVVFRIAGAPTFFYCKVCDRP